MDAEVFDRLARTFAHASRRGVLGRLAAGAAGAALLGLRGAAQVAADGGGRCLDAGWSCSGDGICCSGRCDGGLCVEGECRVDTDCPGADVCRRAMCIVADCGPTHGCGPNQACCDGICRMGGCCSDDDCPGAVACILDEFGSLACQVLACAVDADCASGVCCSGVCQPDACCAGDSDCDGGLRCCDGACLECCVDADCDDGNACTVEVCGPVSRTCYNVPVIDPCDECSSADGCDGGPCCDGRCCPAGGACGGTAAGAAICCITCDLGSCCESFEVNAGGLIVDPVACSDTTDFPDLPTFCCDGGGGASYERDPVTGAISLSCVRSPRFFP